MAGSCELGNELSGSVQGGSFDEQLNESYNLLHGSYLIILLS